MVFRLSPLLGKFDSLSFNNISALLHSVLIALKSSTSISPAAICFLAFDNMVSWRSMSANNIYVHLNHPCGQMTLTINLITQFDCKGIILFPFCRIHHGFLQSKEMVFDIFAGVLMCGFKVKDSLLGTIRPFFSDTQ